jgi:hypothetical protein
MRQRAEVDDPNKGKIWEEEKKKYDHKDYFLFTIFV